VIERPACFAGPEDEGAVGAGLVNGLRQSSAVEHFYPGRMFLRYLPSPYPHPSPLPKGEGLCTVF